MHISIICYNSFMKIGLVVGSLAVLAILFFTIVNTNTKNTNVTETNTAKDLDSQKDSGSLSDQPQENGKYITYTENVLNESANKRRVLFFYANWCPTCIPADKDFKENIDKIPDDVVLIRVNYNDTETDENEKALARKYVVTYQHTFVQLDSSGNKVKIWNGGQLKELLSNLN